MAVKDPVCGMKIEKQDAVATADYKGKTYYFCSQDCKVEFQEHPEDYADKSS
jgi:YHS domain-containing protein